MICCIVCTFFRQSYAQLLPAHYTWKVYLRYYFSGKNYFKIEVRAILICALSKIKYGNY